MNKSSELTFSVSLLLSQRISFWHSHATRLCKCKTFISSGCSITKGHMERTCIHPRYIDWKTLWIISHNLESHRLNQNLWMALILTVNSNHRTLQGLIADFVHLSLWMLFSIHGITPMAGCLQFPIWLCVLLKAVLSKYQSGFPSGWLSVCLWSIWPHVSVSQRQAPKAIS